MESQPWQAKNDRIRADYLAAKRGNPERFAAPLNLSWSNWGFGMEPLETSVKRLAQHGVQYIELHGNRYGEDLGYKPADARKTLADHGVRVGGICGMFSTDNDLSSNRGVVRQRAIDYIRRTIDQAVDFEAKYILVVPAAVGRPDPIDAMEFDRSVETLRIVADDFSQAGIRAAIEPIRSAEVSIVHTFAEAERYIEAVNSPGVQHINGDVYHMLVEESHIAETLVRHGKRLTNLHLADTNRCALGDGMLDVDTLMMALYLVGYNNDACFCTPEPLGPGGAPYPAMYGRPDPAALDALVARTVSHWKAREACVRGL
ncbi:MAG TPA: sugar phosphate isomerase/epimerase [Candidatus Hydrogenedentes bacterium]|nr:sugar phosphate isomerase/epimerase [Candidatus Hydrogenedentota bacterium]HOS01967.1 sugar phosphate isomerase/epimerase [Candidatus Hydrogenedentota bacterium]